MSELRRSMLPFATGAAIWLAAITAGCSGSPNDAQKLLAESSTVMATLSFVHEENECPTCPPPIVSEYAPPDAMLLSGSKGHDDWPFYLYLDQHAYFSSAGVRWLTGDEGRLIALLLVTDPRAMLRAVTEPEITGAQMVEGRPATVVSAAFDLDRHMANLPEALRIPELGDEYRTFYAGVTVRFWIDDADRRVLQVELARPPPEPEVSLVRFDYARPVQLPATVRSMPVEEAGQFQADARLKEDTLLDAITGYRTLHGAYPAQVDQATLAEVLPAAEWPRNVFSGNPVAPSSEPGDFVYLTSPGGEHFEFTLNGWDGASFYYDSLRFGHRE